MRSNLPRNGASRRSRNRGVGSEANRAPCRGRAVCFAARGLRADAHQPGGNAIMSRTSKLALVNLAVAAVVVAWAALAGCRQEPRLPSNPNPIAREGCWVDLFENENYDGEHAHDRIDGPGEWTTLRD